MRKTLSQLIEEQLASQTAENLVYEQIEVFEEAINSFNDLPRSLKKNHQQGKTLVLKLVKGLKLLFWLKKAQLVVLNKLVEYLENIYRKISLML